MTTTNGFFQEMSTFFRKMTTSNEVRDLILDVDDVQTSSNIYDADDDGQSWSIITPYLGIGGTNNNEAVLKLYLSKLNSTGKMFTQSTPKFYNTQ